jgi:hypothetical protein
MQSVARLYSAEWYDDNVWETGKGFQGSGRGQTDVISRHFHGEIDENYKISQSGWDLNEHSRNTSLDCYHNASLSGENVNGNNKNKKFW